jgi:23S rRNA (uridine2552-2'-O)-methyltransferase
MSRKDEYYNRSKQQGYRSRAAYKLKQMDADAGLLSEGSTVVDLGGAPGGWIQVATEAVGDEGRVVGVDLQRIDPIGEDEAGDAAVTVETVRGDMTEDATRERAGEAAGGGADTVLSDMAPNMTGEYNLDHARSVHLARQAFETALTLLDAGGDLVVKVFEGPDVEDLREDMEAEFEYVRTMGPDASRDSSSEIYLVARNRLTAPVRPGDTLEVEITDTGAEGDGIARVDGFTLFVPDAEEGETVAVEVGDVKPNFGFAERLE